MLTRTSKTSYPQIYRGTTALSAVLVLAVGLTACKSVTNQELGTVGGAVGGVLLGSFFGSGTGQIIAMIAGGALGAYIGNEIGAYLDEQDKEAIAQDQKELMLSESGDGTRIYENPETGVRAVSRVTKEEDIVTSTNFVKPQNVFISPELTLIGQPYVVEASSLNLRNGPGTDYAKVGGFPKGTVLNAVGRVSETDWLLVSKGGVTLGYLKSANGRFFAPVELTKIAEAKKNDTFAKADITDLDADKLAALDAIMSEPAPSESADDREERATALLDNIMSEQGLQQVAAPATSNCKTITVEVSSKEGDGEQTNTFCRQANGTYIKA
tara:strand:- start:19101 stop:20078 length:978 start_codon:yes stop_codon:yes gene_type:complete